MDSNNVLDLSKYIVGYTFENGPIFRVYCHNFPFDVPKELHQFICSEYVEITDVTTVQERQSAAGTDGPTIENFVASIKITMVEFRLRDELKLPTNVVYDEIEPSREIDDFLAKFRQEGDEI